LKKALKDIWCTNNQQDSFEFALALLDHMDNCLPESMKPFAGKFRQTLCCKKCLNKSVKKENFYTLNLPLMHKNTHRVESNADEDDKENKMVEEKEKIVQDEDQNYSLESLVDNFCSKENMILEHKLFCNSKECADTFQDGEKIVQIEEAPNILLVNIAYFEYDKASNSRKKIYKKKVSYEEVFVLPVHPDEFRTEYVTYSLYGVIVHSGSSCHSGHYFAYAKCSQMQGDKNLWYKLNDARTSEVSGFGSFASEIADPSSSDVAYMLFYVKEGFTVNLHEELSELKKQVECEDIQLLKLAHSRQFAAKKKKRTKMRKRN
jgi:uncharacterized UBP type Zn finger protein